MRHGFNVPGVLSSGNLIYHARKFTQCSDSLLGKVLSFENDVSAGIFSESNSAFIKAFLSDKEAANLLSHPTMDKSEIISKLTAWPGEVGKGINYYLYTYGAAYRMINSFNLDTPYGLEAPSTVVEGIKRAIEKRMLSFQQHFDVSYPFPPTVTIQKNNNLSEEGLQELLSLCKTEEHKNLLLEYYEDAKKMYK